MAQKTLFTKKVRNPVTNDWISLYRLKGDDNGDLTDIQVFNADGTLYNIGKINPTITIEDTPVIVDSGATFDAVSNFTLDEYGRLTGITLTTYQVPQSISVSFAEPTDSNTLLWIQEQPSE